MLSRRARQRGSQLVEFAMVAPVLLLLVFGTVGVCMTQTAFWDLERATQQAVIEGGLTPLTSGSLPADACHDAAAAAIASMGQSLAGSSVSRVTVSVTCAAPSPLPAEVCTGSVGSHSIGCSTALATRAMQITVASSGEVDVSAVGLGYTVNTVSAQATGFLDGSVET